MSAESRSSTSGAAARPPSLKPAVVPSAPVAPPWAPVGEPPCAPPWAPLRSKPRTDERRDADAAAPRRTSFVANAAALVGPAVVRVDVERGEGRPEYSHASGFVYDGHNALVLTNAHVVQGATRVAVVTAEGDRKDATVLGVDARDVAEALGKVDGADALRHAQGQASN